MSTQETQSQLKRIKFFSRISKSGNKFLISIPVERYDDIDALKNKTLSVVIKEAE